MSLHGKSTGKNIHTPFRFVVADATERLAVSTNPDGSALDNTALNTKLIQVNDNSEWRLSSISPVTFMAIAPANAVWTEITQAAYDALSPPDASTLYVIVG